MLLAGPSVTPPLESPAPEAQAEAEAAVRVLGTICPMTGLSHQTTRFLWDFARIIMWNHEHLGGENETVCYHQPGFGFAAEVRNKACQSFLESEGGDWLLFLDTDNTFPPDIVKRMLKSQAEIAAQHGACDILTALYFKKWAPFQPLVYKRTDRDPFAHFHDYPPEPFETVGSGAGCLLIQREVLRRINQELRVQPFGWLGELHNLRTPVWMEKFARDFTTEDFPFNLRCEMLGYKTWCDPRIKLGHIMLCEVTESDFLIYQARCLAAEQAAQGRLPDVPLGSEPSVAEAAVTPAVEATVMPFGAVVPAPVVACAATSRPSRSPSAVV